MNIQDEHGQTCLLICCIHSHKNLANILIESSIAGHTPEPLDVDMKDNRGLTPLNCTAIKGDLHFMKLLIEKGGARIDEQSPKGCTALLYAARGGYGDMVRYLLDKGANSLQQDNSGGTVAHHSIEKDKEEILDILVQYSVDIDIADNAGRTPLFEATENNKISSARLLVNNGARVDITDYSGHTPLYCATRDGNEEIVKILIDIGKAKVDHFGKATNPKDPEYEDMEFDNEDEKLIMEGLEASRTPLHVACLLGYKSIADYLLKVGKADPNILGDKGFNTLHFSVLGKQPEITQFLLKQSKVDFNVRDYKGRSVEDLIKIYMPIYSPHYKALIDSLPPRRSGEDSDEDNGKMTNYYTPEDDRVLTGVQNNDDIYKLYEEAKVDPDADVKDDKHTKLFDVEEDEIKLEKGKEPDTIIERVFGMKTA